MVSLTALVVASSMMIGQAAPKTAMPTEVQQQIDSHLIGNWVVSGKFGDQEFSGTETWRWQNGKTSLLIEGTLEIGGERFQSTSLAGWDANKKALVVTGFVSGDTWTTHWTEFSPEEWKGRISGVYEGTPYDSPAKIQFLKDSVRYEDTTSGKPWVSIGTRPGPAEQNKAEKVFKAFADFAVGGKWVPLDDDGKSEEKYELILNGKFLLHTSQREGQFPPNMSIVGIDPETKQCTFWDFNAAGDVSSMTIDLDADGSLVMTTARPAPGSDAAVSFRLILIDADTVKAEMTMHSAAGETKQVFDLKRKR
jgi:hypothetical protein